MKRLPRPAAVLLLPLLLVGCPSSDDDSDAPVPEDLEATLPALGPYGVGYIEESVTYDPMGTGDRTLRLAIWYPTDDTDGPEVRYQGFFPAPGVIDAPDPASGPFPLVVYSHGHQGYAESAGRLVTHLVSHGYVVAAPDHTGNTSFDDAERDTSIYWQRATDIGAVLDHVQADSHPLAAQQSDDPVVGIGHSFGGYTVHGLAGAQYDTPAIFDACAQGDTQDFCSPLTPTDEAVFEAGVRDPRITSIIATAPGNLDLFGGGAGLAAIDVPVLHMTGGLDNPTLDDATWAAHERSGNLRVHLSDGGHNIFSDAASGLDSGPQYIDPEVGWPAIGAYWVAWIRAHHGDSSVQPVLDGTLVFGPTTEITLGE